MISLSRGSAFADFTDVESAATCPMPADVTADASARRIPYFKVLVLFGASAFLVMLVWPNTIDLDLWHEMALVRESLRQGHLLTRDVFAYTPTVSPVVHHEWGAGAVAYAIWSLAGLGGIVALKYLLVSICAVLCVKASPRQCDIRVLGPCLLIASVLACVGFESTVRAQNYTYVFVALLLFLLRRDMDGARAWIPIFLLVVIFWVNMHGGVVSGIGIFVLYIGESLYFRRRTAHLFAVLLAVFACLLVNPFGTAYLSYIHHAVTMSRPNIPEWRPLWITFPKVLPFMIAAVALFVYSVLTLRPRNYPGFLIVGACAFEAAVHTKMLPLFAIAWVCFVPAALEKTVLGRRLRDFQQREFAVAVCFWLALAGTSVAESLSRGFWRPNLSPYFTPVGAVGFLRDNNFRGKMLVPFTYGAYVSWVLYPNVKVSVDSRYEVAYDGALVDEHFRFYKGEPGGDRLLDQYPPDLVLCPADSPALTTLQKRSWIKIYSDAQNVVFATPGVAAEYSSAANQAQVDYRAGP